MLPLLVSAALAAPSGYSIAVASYDGCEISLGPTMKDGVVPIHAECYWPDASIDKFKAVMSDWHRHADVFTVVVDSDIVRQDGDRTLVHQLHRSKGISDREVLQWMTHTVVDGFDRYGWTTAADQPLTVKDGNVRTARADGYWQAKADPRGGILLVNHLEYDPGGSVPGFLVHWFQTSGTETNLTEVHAVVK
jgi:hypothetical protein